MSLKRTSKTKQKNPLVGLAKDYRSTGSKPYLILMVFLLIPGLGPYELFLLKPHFDRYKSQGELSLGHVPITNYSLWPEEREISGIIWVTKLGEMR